MLQKITGEAPFQVLTNAFSISPSNEGYQLQISSDGINYSTLFTVGAGVTRLVTGVANGSYYRLSGNQSDVIVNWQRNCGGGGGGESYILPAATSESLGGVIIGSGVTVDSAGTISVDEYSLPIASSNTLGGVMIGSGVTIDAEGHISVDEYSLPIASSDTLGGVKIGSGVTVDSAGTISVEQADPTKLLAVSELPSSAADGTVMAFAGQVYESRTYFMLPTGKTNAEIITLLTTEGTDSGLTIMANSNQDSIRMYVEDDTIKVTYNSGTVYSLSDLSTSITWLDSNSYYGAAVDNDGYFRVYILKTLWSGINPYIDGIHQLSDVSVNVGVHTYDLKQAQGTQWVSMNVDKNRLLPELTNNSRLFLRNNNTNLSWVAESDLVKDTFRMDFSNVATGRYLRATTDGYDYEWADINALSPTSANSEDRAEGTVYSYMSDYVPNAGSGIKVLAIAMGQLESRISYWQELNFCYGDGTSAFTVKLDNGVLSMQRGSGPIFPITAVTEGRWTKYSGTLYVYRDNSIFAVTDTSVDLETLKNYDLSTTITPVHPKEKEIYVVKGYGGDGSWVALDLNGQGTSGKDIVAVQRFYKIAGPTGNSYSFNFTMENGKSINFVWNNTDGVFVVGSESGATLDIPETETAPEFYGFVDGDNWGVNFICSDESMVEQFSSIDGYTGFVDIMVRLNRMGVQNLVKSPNLSVSNIWKGTQAEYDILGTPDSNTLYIIV